MNDTCNFLKIAFFLGEIKAMLQNYKIYSF